MAGYNSNPIFEHLPDFDISKYSTNNFGARIAIDNLSERHRLAQWMGDIRDSEALNTKIKNSNHPAPLLDVDEWKARVEEEVITLMSLGVFVESYSDEGRQLIAAKGLPKEQLSGYCPEPPHRGESDLIGHASFESLADSVMRALVEKGTDIPVVLGGIAEGLKGHLLDYGCCPPKLSEGIFHQFRGVPYDYFSRELVFPKRRGLIEIDLSRTDRELIEEFKRRLPQLRTEAGFEREMPGKVQANKNQATPVRIKNIFSCRVLAYYDLRIYLEEIRGLKITAENYAEALFPNDCNKGEDYIRQSVEPLWQMTKTRTFMDDASNLITETF